MKQNIKLNMTFCSLTADTRPRVQNITNHLLHSFNNQNINQIQTIQGVIL